jgi:hypothetical protein
MIWGMSTATFTAVHVALSLVGIGAGLVVLYGMLGGKLFGRWNGLFLLTTIATSVTGFGFPFDHLLPSHKVGIVSLVLLAVALLALYGGHLSGVWRPTYVITAVMALWLNTFVLVAQLFLKVPALHAVAPNGKEPPFAISQLVVLVIFIVLGVKAVKRFRPAGTN